METKICSLCKRDLPISQFYKSKNAKSGLKARCKECCEKDVAFARSPRRYTKKLPPEDEKAANARALKKLVKIHPGEYLALLEKERMTIARRQPN